MRLLCVSAPLPGHLDWGGYLPTAAELARRGHEVVWASGAAVRLAVEEQGVEFHELAETGWRWPPPPPLARAAVQDDAEWHRLRAARALDQWFDVERVAAAADELIALIRRQRTDVVVTEMFIAAAGIAAEAMSIPLVVVGWPAFAPQARNLPPDPTLAAAQARFAALKERFSVTGLNFAQHGPPALRSPRLHVSYWCPAWHQGAMLAEQTRLAGGPALLGTTPDPTLPPPDDRPWVFVTLGTSFAQDPAFFAAATQAVTALDGVPIVALGDGASASAGVSLAPGTVVRERVRFAEVLPFSAAAIHHGGAGTTHALARAGVPQIVVPHAGDQLYQARGVERSGVGIHLPPAQATQVRLEDALAAVVPDLSPFRARAAALQAELASLGGAAAAATWIEELA
jgi:MGT family glycosyltransferase